MGDYLGLLAWVGFLLALAIAACRMFSGSSPDCNGDQWYASYDARRGWIWKLGPAGRDSAKWYRSYTARDGWVWKRDPRF